MSPWLRRTDAVLRGQAIHQPWGLLLLCSLFYGAVMGTSAGIWGDRAWQVAFSAVKVPVLLLATPIIALPSFFVVNTVMGVRSDFARALRAVVGSQAVLAIILVSLSPLTAVWYLSSADYNAAILFNALIFGVSSLGAQVLLRKSYRPLIARDPRHRWLLRAWITLYAFVGIQLGWTLRPFIGSPSKPVEFFRGGELENAYVIVARMIWQLVAG